MTHSDSLASPAEETTGQSLEPPRWLARDTAYMRYVADVCSTPQGRRDLRDGLNIRRLDESWRMMRHLRPRIPNWGPDATLAHLAVAGLYAHQAANPTTDRTTPILYDPAHGNLGWSLERAVRQGVLREDSTADLLERVARQRRLQPALALLHRPVTRMTAAGIPVSWPRLLRDLNGWPKYRTQIADAWMQSHYSPDLTRLTETPEEIPA
ncbi:type I-E CRISPR-associated protein Cse2/CasB [Streptomyces actuosus]|uniref:Type I-E CRISPR-associated protein Cse2/CasB n=1 Tax=Streptomyces actuosus TaxID=1885 RepID=A0ABS2VR57_STRAS|nr:type I-E CRISPR-associated protein Cse2/CasB [Streptomyces actuosus]MBN0045592.1 type I-E CRISPR-associated protein Cse2/CasB [Streptomyces actuosus]